jgi:hypothetical protein
MTKRDFFILSIRLFGLYSGIIAIFSIIPSQIGMLLSGISHGFDFFYYLLIILAGILLPALMFVLLVFYAHKIVDWLQLEKGFDDDRIEFVNFDTEQIVKISSFLIGGLMILNNFPEFVVSSIRALRASAGSQGTIEDEYFTFQDKFYWGVSALNIVIGYLLITNYDKVARFLNRKKSAPEN